MRPVRRTTSPSLIFGLAAHQYDTNAVRVQVQNHAGYVVGQFN